MKINRDNARPGGKVYREVLVYCSTLVMEPAVAFEEFAGMWSRCVDDPAQLERLKSSPTSKASETAAERFACAMRARIREGLNWP